MKLNLAGVKKASHLITLTFIKLLRITIFTLLNILKFYNIITFYFNVLNPTCLSLTKHFYCLTFMFLQLLHLTTQIFYFTFKFYNIISFKQLSSLTKTISYKSTRRKLIMYLLVSSFLATIIVRHNTGTYFTDII